VNGVGSRRDKHFENQNPALPLKADLSRTVCLLASTGTLMSELIEQGGGVEEFLKTIRNSHYLLLFSSVALVLLSYSSYLTRIYQGAYDEIIGFEKIAVRRYFETKGWDFQVGGPKTSYGIPKLSSMPKTVRKVMERQNIFTFDEKKVLLEVDDEYKKMAREAMRNAGVGFAEGMDF
jgi:hypothetical protein